MIDDCFAAFHAKGFCYRHYMRNYYRHAPGVKEKSAEYKRRNLSKNREANRLRMQEYRLNNPEYVERARVRAREYKKSDDGKMAVRKSAHKRNSLLGVVDEDYGLWCSFLLEFNYCFRCYSFENLQIDHIVPVSLGGESTKGNVQVLCRACNTSKGNRNSMDYRPQAVIDLCVSVVNSH